MKHRDRGYRSPMTMCWISPAGHLCRFTGGPLTRVEAKLPPVVVEQGSVWSIEDEKEQDR